MTRVMDWTIIDEELIACPHYLSKGDDYFLYIPHQWYVTTSRKSMSCKSYARQFYNNNNIQFLETHNTIKIVSMHVKSEYWTEIMKFQN